MAPNRRDFIGGSLTAAAALTLPRGLRGSTGDVARKGLLDGAEPSSASKPLSILFLGGTGFIGPHMVRHAMYRGHKVTLFNRGRTAPDLFPGAEALVGDRDGQLDALKGRSWDAVVDNSGYVPRHVRDSAELLHGNVGRYLFISTGSVYQFDQDELTESSAVLPIDDPTSEDVNKYYGPLKVLAEEAVRERYGNQATVLRLHIVAGPGDPTDRFTYWPARIDRGGEVLAPGDPSHPVQYIDVRDLAEFTIHALEQDIAGTFNTAGPALDETRMDEFLYAVKGTTSSRVQFTWVDDAFLREKQARFPLWVSQNTPARGIMKVRSQKAVAAGLKFRPIAVTATDTLAWLKSEPAERLRDFPLNLDKEAELLAAWKATRASTG